MFNGGGGGRLMLFDNGGGGRFGKLGGGGRFFMLGKTGGGGGSGKFDNEGGGGRLGKFSDGGGIIALVLVLLTGTFPPPKFNFASNIALAFFIDSELPFISYFGFYCIVCYLGMFCLNKRASKFFLFSWKD